MRHTHAAHRGCPAVVALLSTLHVDLGVAVGGVEPARLLPLLSLLQELEGQPRGAVPVLLEHEGSDSGRDLYLALVPWLLPDDGMPVGITRSVALQQEKQDHTNRQMKGTKPQNSSVCTGCMFLFLLQLQFVTAITILNPMFHFLAEQK